MKNKNPYKGLFQYTANDEEQFFGRTQELRDIIELIQAKQLVTIYGESGTGKTSLINAKLFPELNRMYFFTVYIRINYSSEKTPLEQVKERISSELIKMDKKLPAFDAETTLLEFASKTSLFDGLVKPVLFFDQFEELFTLGPKHKDHQEIIRFVEQLSDLVEVRSTKLQPGGTNGTTLEPTANGMDIPTRNILNFRTVLSMRQDYVGNLDDLKFKIPSLLYGKYRLRKFSISQAYEAIAGPITKLAPLVLLPENIKLVIEQMGIEKSLINTYLDGTDNSASDYIDSNVIDPTLLSLFCHEVFNDVAASIEGGAGNWNDIQRFNALFAKATSSMSITKIIERYYKTHLSHKPKLQRAIESTLINEEGKRLLIPLDEFIKTTGVSNEHLYDLIKSSALLRLYSEGGKEEVELVHDQIAKQSLASRKRRELIKASIRSLAIIITSTGVVAAFILFYTYSQREDLTIKGLKVLLSISKKETEEVKVEINQEREYSSRRERVQNDSISKMQAALAKLRAVVIANTKREQDLVQLTDPTFHEAESGLIIKLLTQKKYANSRFVYYDTLIQHTESEKRNFRQRNDLLTKNVRALLRVNDSLINLVRTKDLELLRRKTLIEEMENELELNAQYGPRKRAGSKGTGKFRSESLKKW